MFYKDSSWKDKENKDVFDESRHSGSRSSQTNETGDKLYTPIFKKRRQTPPATRRPSEKSKSPEYILPDTQHMDSDDEAELSSHVDHISICSSNSK